MPFNPFPLQQEDSGICLVWTGSLAPCSWYRKHQNAPAALFTKMAAAAHYIKLAAPLQLLLCSTKPMALHMFS